MRRGEIRWVEFDPVRGSEANKRRPAVIISNDRANAVVDRTGRGVVTVVPVTSNVRAVYPFQILLTAGTAGLERESKVQAEQVRALSAGHVGDVIGVVPGRVMADLDDALRLHLDL